MNRSTCALSVGVLTLECRWNVPVRASMVVNQRENSLPWSDWIVWNGNEAMFCAFRTNRRLAGLVTRSAGAACPHRECTSIRAYADRRSDGAPLCTASICTRIPGVFATGRSGYWCHFLFFENRWSSYLRTMRSTDERLTRTPSPLRR